jgi:hypothetical protein
MVLVALLRGAVMLLTVFVGLWTVLSMLEALLWTPSSIRAVLLVVACVTLSGAMVWWIGVPLAKGMGLLPGLGDMDVARLMGRREAVVGDSLINLLQLSAGAHSDAPPDFVDQAVKRLARPLESVSWKRIEEFRSVNPLFRWSVIPLSVLLIFLLAAPGVFLSASERLLHPGTTFEKPAPFSLQVFPGHAERVAGESLIVRVEAEGGLPEMAPVVERVITGESRPQVLDLQADGVAAWSLEFPDIMQPFRYRVTSAGISSEWFDVHIVNRPIVQQLQLELVHPDYTRIPARVLEPNVGDVTALTGTVVRPRIRTAGAEVETGWIAFASGDSIALGLDAGMATASFVIRHSDAYHVTLRSTEGVTNARPIPYRITAVSDGAPSISILAPEPLANLDDEQRAFVLLHITDDFGFRSLMLHWRLAESRFGTVQETFSSTTLPLSEPYLLDQEFGHEWDVASTTGLTLAPGDVIEYYAEITDNDTMTGPKRAQSRVHRLRMPSIAEKYEAVDELEDRTEESLEELMEKARKAREDFEELRRNLMQKTEAEWQEERALEQLQEQQKQMEEAVEAVSQKMEELADEMSRNDLVSEETLNTFEELQQVVEEVRSPDLMEALREMQESIEQMNPNQMQEAMEKFEFSEQQYQERLERSLNLFKNFRVQQDLEEVERRAEDLARTEEQLAEETQAENAQEKAEDLAQQQELASEEMSALEEKMEEIRERMEELKNQPTEQMQDLLEDTQDQEIPQKMKENAEQMRQGDMNQAQQQQQEMSEQLDQLSGDLSNMQMNAAGAQMQLNLAGIRSALEDVLTLSVGQEQLRVDVSGYAVDSPQLREAAQLQVRLSESLSVVADSLQRIAREVPQMSRTIQEETGNALRQMSEATSALTERAARRAVNNQRTSMTHMNELALMLSELLNQMNNASGAGQSNMSMEQMMEQLQNMGQQQQQINQQIQQLLNDMQGNRLTQDMTDRLRQMGAQQEQIRQQLRELSRNRELRNKALGDLNRIAEQMQETIEELQGSRVSRQTVERQQEILTRLLEASRSLEQRGRENKREGRTAEEILRDSPAELTPSEQAERLRRDLIRALESGYAEDYQMLIRRYFELLQQEAPRQ